MKAVLITGAGGALGGSAAREFAQHGWTVFAADLVAPAAGPGLVPVQLDVTDSASCAAAAELVAGQADGLDAVVNFAGVLEIGPLIEVSEAQLRRSLDVNVVGTFLVNQAMFGLIRRRGGRIINVSSEAGWFKPQPFSAPYSVTKHAVEAYSEVLRRELAFLGISVSVVAPGAFKSHMTQDIGGRFAAATRPGSPFAPMLEKVSALSGRMERGAQHPAVLAEAVWDAATSARPKARYRVGTRASDRLFNSLPNAVLDRVLQRLIG